GGGGVAGREAPAPARACSRRTEVAIGVAGLVGAVATGVLVAVALRLVDLTMLVVDPARMEEAKAALTGSTIAGISSSISRMSTSLILGSFLTSLGLLATALASAIVTRERLTSAAFHRFAVAASGAVVAGASSFAWRCH